MMPESKLAIEVRYGTALAHSSDEKAANFPPESKVSNTTHQAPWVCVSQNAFGTLLRPRGDAFSKFSVPQFGLETKHPFLDEAPKHLTMTHT